MVTERPSEPSTVPKEKQMSATQVAHEIMSGGELRLT